MSCLLPVIGYQGRLWLLLMILSLSVAITAYGVEVPSSQDQDEAAAIAAEEAAQQQAMQADWKAAAARAGRVRTYRTRAVDKFPTKLNC